MLQESFKIFFIDVFQKTRRNVDPVKSVHMFKENDSMSEEVILKYDEMYLKKSEDM